MRKLSFLMVLLGLVTVANAQFSAGDRYLRGSFSANYNKEEVSQNIGTESWGFNLAPSFMKFKTERRATGFRLLTSRQYTNNYNATSNAKNNNTAVGAGVFLFNVLPISKNFFLSAETGLDATYGWGKQTNSSVPMYKAEITEFNIAASVTPSVGYKLTNRLIVGLNFSNLLRVGYQTRKTEQTNAGGGNSVSKTKGLSLFSSLNNTNIGNLGISFGWKLK